MDSRDENFIVVNGITSEELMGVMIQISERIRQYGFVEWVVLPANVQLTPELEDVLMRCVENYKATGTHDNPST